MTSMKQHLCAEASGSLSQANTKRRYGRIKERGLGNSIKKSPGMIGTSSAKQQPHSG